MISKHDLPERALLAWSYPDMFWYSDLQLRDIANRHKLSKRRKFYHNTYRLCLKYQIDKTIESDLAASSESAKIYRELERSCRRFWNSISSLLETRAAYSFWSDVQNRAHVRKQFDTLDLPDNLNFEFLERQIRIVAATAIIADAALPRPPRGRRPHIALRRWVNGHLEFWENDLGRPVTVTPDQSYGMSRCHQFLYDLLLPLDPQAAVYLASILRERRTSRRPLT